MIYIKKKLNEMNISKVKSCSVDNFQGEENEIILVSLVRSNSEGRLGFIKNDNRINVALSRARCGMYVIGNFKMIA
jgi:superfamily I DNA and/or RNA helicase